MYVEQENIVGVGNISSSCGRFSNVDTERQASQRRFVGDLFVRALRATTFARFHRQVGFHLTGFGCGFSVMDFWRG